ncbi:hypothetical protein MPTK1_1g08670 [Marchantia polymorpha subsp. ruderalis]|uniref:SMP-LTD domain-containing protein n=2 Tax=Marchantia polymorpha TaxID=3197 RepID=A0AAF6AN09_MARPO|nr:hypothetical protein MARPO_0036s0110 [Marchantia polymorpha]BBM97829.1 hypothetical protein Mp_1g08670 [Marchantia polymorpha subsp. ruderalis]|eukprot:PTQ41132.1 hypothetical protein MARPO_0036s0110 [Marchantia polymorpha]
MGRLEELSRFCESGDVWLVKKGTPLTMSGGDGDSTSDSVVAALSAYSARYYKWTAMFGCGSAFLSGVLVILLIEALVVMFVVMRSVEKKQRLSIPHSSSVSVEIPENKLDIKLTGGVWITALPLGDIKKMYTRREKALREKLAKEEKNDNEKGSKDSKSKRDVLRDYTQITPVFRRAKLHGTILHLSGPGAPTGEHVRLEGCVVLAVSGSTEPTRKWAKKFPLKVHHASREVYKGSHDCLLYLDTGWEKEKWCEALRAAAKPQSNEGDPFFKQKKEYKEYLLRVENQFPFFSLANSGRLAYVVDDRMKALKGEPNSSSLKKSRQLWKKFIRRNGKSGRESKSSDGRQDVVKGDEMAVAEEGSSRGSNSSVGGSPGDAVLAASSTEDFVPEASLAKDEIFRTVSMPSNFIERDPAVESMEPALLCVNTLFARLFFDLYHSERVVSRIRSILQRQLSKVPTPNYIGKIECTHLDLGNSPPLARNMTLLPVNEEGSWGLEADLEYHGGAILTIETRIDVRDSNSREKVVAQGLEPTLAGAAAADLLAKGLETYSEELNLNVQEGNPSADQRNSGGTSSSSRPDVRSSEEASRKGWMHSQLTNVKSIMSKVAEQVSQVPLALTIKVVQVRGKLQMRIKPPPSDRVWFSFTQMPTLELVPEPCIGDHKISSGPLGQFIVNQIKILLRDTMVFPQFEDLSYSWMMSVKDNWLPRDAVPLPFVSEQASDQNNDKERRDEKRSQLRKEGSVDTTRIDTSGAGVGPSKSLPGISSQYEQDISPSPPLSPLKRSVGSLSLPEMHVDTTLEYDLRRPLLEKEGLLLEASTRVSEIACLPPEKNQHVSVWQAQQASSSDSESGHVNQGVVDQLERQASSRVPGSKRSKVLGFGKKMGTKLEEKSRNVLEKIRDRSQMGPEHSHE